ncbi:HET-domain-containing protein, partial [Trematosphaeria pertusa]
CSRQHRICNSILSSDSWYPSRLIDVGAEVLGLPRLVCTAEETISGRYVSLSHCWGKSEFLQLTESNLECFKKGIPIDALSKTFQDAIEATRCLGMRYIWIDSLCIIQQQDSKDDWLRESPQMGMIYSNSYCNIAATGASDGNDGLFKPRCPHTVFPSAIRNPHRDFELHLTHEHHWEAELLDAPLLERGWVLQERILSPRILHFGRRQLLWECCESEASERLPDQLPSLPVAHQYAGYKSSLTLHPDGGQGLPSTENDPFARASIHALWNRLVSAYSRTNLTYPEDKLIAIAGIAAKIQSGLKTDYLAGLWGDRLTSQLLWRVEQPSRRERPRCYRAPSFSWASVDGTI